MTLTRRSRPSRRHAHSATLPSPPKRPWYERWLGFLIGVLLSPLFFHLYADSKGQDAELNARSDRQTHSMRAVYREAIEARKESAAAHSYMSEIVRCHLQLIEAHHGGTALIPADSLRYWMSLASTFDLDRSELSIAESLLNSADTGSVPENLGRVLGPTLQRLREIGRAWRIAENEFGTLTTEYARVAPKSYRLVWGAMGLAGPIPGSWPPGIDPASHTTAAALTLDLDSLVSDRAFFLLVDGMYNQARDFRGLSASTVTATAEMVTSLEDYASEHRIRLTPLKWPPALPVLRMPSITEAWGKTDESPSGGPRRQDTSDAIRAADSLLLRETDDEDEWER